MRHPRWVGALVAVVALLLAAAPASAQLRSDNVTLEGKLPVPAPIGAHFSTDGDTMFVTGAGGLHAFDVGEPARPTPLGQLVLPHFENEDVDFGHIGERDVVIISNDPSFNLGAFGAFYVIDVTNPLTPTILAIEPTKVPGDVASLMGSEASQTSNGHIANCIPSADDTCAYLYTTGSEDGLTIYDLGDPSDPQFVKTFPMPAPDDPDDRTAGFTHDVFVDRAGVTWVTGEDGTFGFDVSDPENPQLRFRTDSAVLNTDGFGGPGALNPEGEGPLDFLHHNMMRTGITRGAQGTPAEAPGRPGGGPPEAARPDPPVDHTLDGGTGDVVAITEEDYLRPTCEGASQGSLQTWQITGDQNADGSRKLELLDQFTTEGSTLANQQGRDPLTVNCSAHWFDLSDGLIAQGWYDQGVRFLDISDPEDITQVGYWATQGTFWASYFAPLDEEQEVVYGLDTLGGSIDVLRIERDAAEEVTAPVPARWTDRATARTDAVDLGAQHDEEEARGHGHGEPPGRSHGG